MTRTTPTRRRTAAKTPAALTPRVVFLAGLGAVSLCRKQAFDSIDGLAEGADGLRQRADAIARGASNRVARLGKQAKARLAPVRKQAAAFARQAQAEFESRFAPLLAQFDGAPVRAKRPARTAAKRTVRPAAKRARKRA